MTPEPAGGPAAPDEAAVPQRLSAGRYDSFVVRVLSHGREGHMLQGQVTHVATRRSLRFTDPQRVVGFIMAQLRRRAGDGSLGPGDEDLEEPAL